MQEMIEYLENTWYVKEIRDWEDIKINILEKEKEQIKDAWDAGMSEGIGTTMADLNWDREFINYYNETYTK